jgi:hypothetical protein
VKATSDVQCNLIDGTWVEGHAVVANQNRSDLGWWAGTKSALRRFVDLSAVLMGKTSAGRYQDRQ